MLSYFCYVFVINYLKDHLDRNSVYSPTTPNPIINLRPRVLWYHIHLWTTFNMPFVKATSWPAQKSKYNKVTLEFLRAEYVEIGQDVSSSSIPTTTRCLWEKKRVQQCMVPEPVWKKTQQYLVGTVPPPAPILALSPPAKFHILRASLWSQESAHHGPRPSVTPVFFHTQPWLLSLPLVGPQGAPQSFYVISFQQSQIRLTMMNFSALQNITI